MRIVPLTLNNEWHYYVQGSPGNDISDVTRTKSWGAIWVSAIYQNVRHENIIWAISPLLTDINHGVFEHASTFPSEDILNFLFRYR